MSEIDKKRLLLAVKLCNIHFKFSSAWAGAHVFNCFLFSSYLLALSVSGVDFYPPKRFFLPECRATAR